MSIQDSNPERRNLQLLSILLIAFFLGGGDFPSNQIRLQVISATFENPQSLEAVLWSIFGWFVYRYWVVHKSSFVKEFLNETNSFKEKRFIEKFLEKKEKLKIIPKIADPTENETGLMIEKLYWKSKTLTAFVMDKKVNRSEYGSIGGQGPAPSGFKKHIQFTSFRGRVITVRLLLQCFIECPSFSSYIVPYLLAITAVSLAVIDKLF